MSIKIEEKPAAKSIEVSVSGKLTHQDYQQFVPKIEQLIKAVGKIRLLVEMRDFHGWDGAALWDDIKFDIKHFADIDRIAMVGETKWEKGMSVFCRPFTAAKIKYFDKSQIAAARVWLEEPKV